MSLTLAQTFTALAPGLMASFAAQGGTSPYVYTVRTNGAGGTIHSSTGTYTGPAIVNSDPAKAYDLIQVRDHAGATATARILITSPLGLFSDILQTQLGLDANHCYFWDQKIFQPLDSGLSVILSVPTCQPFGNTRLLNGVGSGLTATQSVNMRAVIDVDVISRGPAARDQKEQVLLALNSIYSEQQQEANSFQIGRISNQFINLSEIDGSAIPYRYRISFGLTYFVQSTVPVQYFSSFTTPAITVNS